MGVATAVGMFLSSVAFAQAQTPVIANTWVSGTVFDANHNPVHSGSVTVHCGAGSQLATIQSDGSYAVTFDQSVCKAGDTAQGSASTSEGSGSSATTVQNTVVNGPVVDLDIAVIDITVPEFGKIGAAISAIGGVAGYLFLRQKQAI